jgi:hypothetical protein
MSGDSIRQSASGRDNVSGLFGTISGSQQSFTTSGQRDLYPAKPDQWFHSLSSMPGHAPGKGAVEPTDTSGKTAPLESSEGGPPSITHPLSSQVGVDGNVIGSSGGWVEAGGMRGIVNLDWFESRGVVKWEWSSREAFQMLAELKERSQDSGRNCTIMEVNGEYLTIRPRGMGGGGHGVSLEFHLEWCGVTIGLSAREGSRGLSNFYLKIPGEACLRVGYDVVRQAVIGLLKEWGGELVDEWMCRLDICLDVPGLCLQADVFPAVRAKQYLKTLKGEDLHADEGRDTGFRVGKRNRVSMTIYDKRLQVLGETNPLYLDAMIRQRWGGVLPEAAARVEFSIGSEYLADLEWREKPGQSGEYETGKRSVSDVLARLPDLVERLVQGDKRPMFMLVDRVPDRENKNQQRCQVHCTWAAIVEMFRLGVGHATNPLHVAKSNPDPQLFKRKFSTIRNGLIDIAALYGSEITTKEDVVNLFLDLAVAFGVTDEALQEQYREVAAKKGRLSAPSTFDPAAAGW